MSRGRNSRNTGSLSPKQTADGINAARRNAKRLAEDAALLLREGRYASAVALAIIAIEEAEKPRILRQVAMESADSMAFPGISASVSADGAVTFKAVLDTDGVRRPATKEFTSESEARTWLKSKVLSERWWEFRSHQAKNVAGILPALFAQGARKLEDFAPAYDSESDHPRQIEQLKHSALYVDRSEANDWQEPASKISRPVAEQFVRLASLLSNTREASVEEIGLWNKHLSPVQDRSDAWKLKALSNWHEEMVARGLADPESPTMEEFIYIGINKKDES